MNEEYKDSPGISSFVSSWGETIYYYPSEYFTEERCRKYHEEVYLDKKRNTRRNPEISHWYIVCIPYSAPDGEWGKKFNKIENIEIRRVLVRYESDEKIFYMGNEKQLNGLYIYKELSTNKLNKDPNIYHNSDTGVCFDSKCSAIIFADECLMKEIALLRRKIDRLEKISHSFFTE